MICLILFQDNACVKSLFSDNQNTGASLFLEVFRTAVKLSVQFQSAVMFYGENHCCGRGPSNLHTQLHNLKELDALSSL